jgi:hypothetical protein
MGSLIWTAIVSLCVAWLLGLVFSFGGSMIHTLLFAAAALTIYSLSSYRGARI